MALSVPGVLVLSEVLVRQIEAEGEGGYPNEICGILIGRDVDDAPAGRRIYSERRR